MATLDLRPEALVALLLAAPVAGRANLVALEPAPSAWRVTVKRGAETAASFDVSPEVGTATVVRLAAAADIDLLSLSHDLVTGGTTRRVRLRVGATAAEVLVSVLVRGTGLAAEVHPLMIDGAPAVLTQRATLAQCVACGGLEVAGAERCSVDGAEVVPVADRPEPNGFLGVYRLGELLGRGGMGSVIAGEHAFLRRPVAVKLLHQTLGDDPLAGRLFLAEARAATSIRHPGIVEVLDYGLLADGRPYMVMERIEGEPLASRVDQGALPAAPALLLARAIAGALAAAHAGGVVHLDLKPANVVVLAASSDEAPQVKLIDFGSSAPAGVTAEGGRISGTPAYMAPEHARGEPADARSDLYALGVVLYELLSGDVPFDFDDPWRVFRAHLLVEPPPLTSPFGTLPTAVHRVVERALAKAPATRYQTADEMIGDIDRALQACRRGPWLRWMP